MSKDIIENPQVVELGNDAGAYRTELVRTLAHCFRLTIAKQAVAALIKEGTKQKFIRELEGCSLVDLEEKLEALRVVDPALVIKAMAAAGHNIKVDAAGDVQIGEPDDNPLGGYVPFNPAEFG